MNNNKVENFVLRTLELMHQLKAENFGHCIAMLNKEAHKIGMSNNAMRYLHILEICEIKQRICNINKNKHTLMQIIQELYDENDTKMIAEICQALHIKEYTIDEKLIYSEGEDKNEQLNSYFI